MHYKKKRKIICIYLSFFVSFCSVLYIFLDFYFILFSKMFHCFIFLFSIGFILYPFVWKLVIQCNCISVFNQVTHIAHFSWRKGTWISLKLFLAIEPIYLLWWLYIQLFFVFCITILLHGDKGKCSIHILFSWCWSK